MRTLPSREELAREIAEWNGRCGHIADDRICLRLRDHTNDHDYEPLTTTIPFQ